MKKFWKKTEGFTLVELIVVIAILGILAGVGTVGYSGYIKKANMAADETLLRSLNNAYAVACIESGRDAKDTTASAITIGTDKVVAKTDIVVTTPADKATAIQDAFEKYYEGGEFKVMTALNFANGMFVDANGGETYSYTFAGSTVTISASDKAILSGDNAFKNRGSAALLNDVAVLENLLDTGIGDDVLNAVKQSDEFLWALGSYAGMTQGDDSDDVYLEKVAAYMMDTNNKDAVYSAQIMFAASNAANTTDAQIADLFTGTVTSNIEVKNADGSTNNQQTMANAALAYGMYTAFVQQYPDDENADNFTLAVNSDAFEAYYNSDKGQADLEAYKAAMNIIGDNTDNSAVTSSILTNGISGNDDLAKLMKDIMGN